MAFTQYTITLLCCLLLRSHAAEECLAPGSPEESLDLFFLQRSRLVADESCALMQALDDELRQALGAPNEKLPALTAAEVAREAAMQPAWARGKLPPFSSSDSPVDADPPLAHPLGSTEPCAQVTSIVNGELINGNTVRAWYTAPKADTECGCDAPAEDGLHGISGPLPGCWDQIVMNFAAFEKGRQYDRFGAVFLNGVELLRTTTPEPNSAGITWYINKDVSEYDVLFRQDGEVVLNINNYVTEIYTGIPTVNISFSFYRSPSGKSQREEPQADGISIFRLRNATAETNPLSDLAFTGPEGQASALPPIPRHGPLGAPTQAKLKVYASGHSCEEFWYMSAQTQEAGGGCGGGSYRELLVFIDGLLAGAALPFPVIYTGGINPYLWRPLTGIRSFDIPAYEFDLTPFLYNLTDGQPHQVEVKAYHNDVPTGTWYVNPVLVLYHQSAAVIVGGNVAVTGSALPVVDQGTRYDSPTSYTQTHNASHEYRVEGHLKFASGYVVNSSTFGHLQARSEIRICHNAAGLIDMKQVSRRGSQRGSYQIEVVDEYPFHVFLAYRLTPQLYSIHARADTARESFVQYSRRRYTLKLSNHLVSSAVYDEGLDNNNNTITVTLGEVLQNNRIDVQGEQCFEKRQKAKNGIIKLNEDAGQCSWSEGLYVCGGSVCGEMGGSPFSV